MNAQGEDVVAGVRHVAAAPGDGAGPARGLQAALRHPARRWRSTTATCRTSSSPSRTASSTCCRPVRGKRTAPAALRAAVDMVDEGMIDKARPSAHRPGPAGPVAAPHARPQGVLRGPGHRPRRLAGRRRGSGGLRRGRRPRSGAPRASPVILVRWETNPDDIHGLIKAQGVITSHGGMTSHAAVVARGMGKPCIAGAAGDRHRRAAGEFTVGDMVVKRGRLALHGRRQRPGDPGPGRSGARRQIDENVRPVLGWADADPPPGRAHQRRHPRGCPARPAEFGAEGIGLCRTEHMFMQQERLPHVQAMIMAGDDRGAEEAPGQAAALPARGLPGHLPGDGRPAGHHPPARPAAARVPARLHGTHGRTATAAADRAPPAETIAKRGLAAKVKSLHEANPMLGTRGCAARHPVAGDLRHAGAGHHRGGLPHRRRAVRQDPQVEIMIPLVGFAKELKLMRELSTKTADQVLAERNKQDRLHHRHHDRSCRGPPWSPTRSPGSPTSSASAPTT